MRGRSLQLEALDQGGAVLWEVTITTNLVVSLQYPRVTVS